MENREAIEWLKGCVVAYEVDNKGKPNGNVTCELIQEVIDMAISALEFKDRYDQFWEEVKTAGMRGEETEIHNSGRVFRIREVAQ